MADWDAIREEYLTTDTSLSKLAEKHDVSITTLKKRCSREKWSSRRHIIDTKADTDTRHQLHKLVSAKKLKTTLSIQEAADGLLAHIGMHLNSGEVLSVQSIKALTSALKDLKEIKHDLTEYELREQDARIRKLEREAREETEDDRTVHIIIDNDEDYGT